MTHDEASRMMRRRKAFRWLGFRGARKGAMYGVRYCYEGTGHVCAVYEPVSRRWFMEEPMGKSSMTFGMERVTVVSPEMLQSFYDRGAVAIAECRVRGLI